MSLTGGKKRKVNKGLRDWVAFVKKVQREEKLSYKDAIHRAKQRKDKGEKWMMGGGDEVEEIVVEPAMDMGDMDDMGDVDIDVVEDDGNEVGIMSGGKRRKKRGKTLRRKGKGKGRTARKTCKKRRSTRRSHRRH
jgi:hypothetical protein